MKKLQQARVMLIDSKLKKTGWNPHLKSKYFDLNDFLPRVNKIFHELGLYSHFNLYDGLAKLTITDLETGEKLQFTTQVESTKNLRMPQIGSIMTYSKRYLYMNALEIAEEDELHRNFGYNNNNQTRQMQPQKANMEVNAINAGLTPKIDRDAAEKTLADEGWDVKKLDGWLKQRNIEVKEVSEIPDKEFNELWNMYQQSKKK